MQIKAFAGQCPEFRATERTTGTAQGMAVSDFPTKAAVVVRDDLAPWQRLNVTAFLVSGLIGAAEPDAIGDDYEDADGVVYLPLLGTERHIETRDVGALLAVRSLVSIISRFFYSRLLMTVGRLRLMVSCMAICAVVIVPGQGRGRRVPMLLQPLRITAT